MKSSFFYVYILQSVNDPQRFYSGFTGDLRERLAHHNHGACPHTRKFRPWRIKTAVAFTDRTQALEFERYLKTASGRAFARRRF
jgi:putative endonuclease